MPDPTMDCGCKPGCCSHEHKKVSASIHLHPLYDAGCCPNGQAFAVKDGAVIDYGVVVFHTGKDVDIDGKLYAEVDVSGDDVAGVAMWAIDNTDGAPIRGNQNVTTTNCKLPASW